VGAYARGECLDVARVVAEAAHVADFRQVAPVAQAVGDFVDDGCGGAGGVLRVERDDQDARAAGGAHGVELAADRRLAVAHGPAHVELALACVGEKAGQQLGLLFGVDLERRAFGSPHAGVFLADLAGRVFRMMPLRISHQIGRGSRRPAGRTGTP
jgi:hypothetical protein